MKDNRKTLLWPIGDLRLDQNDLTASIHEVREWLDRMEKIANQYEVTGQVRVRVQEVTWVGHIATAFITRYETDKEKSERERREREDIESEKRKLQEQLNRLNKL